MPATEVRQSREFWRIGGPPAAPDPGRSTRVRSWPLAEVAIRKFDVR